MPIGYHLQVADSISPPDQSDTVAVISSRQDSATIGLYDTLAGEEVVVQDSLSYAVTSGTGVPITNRTDPPVAVSNQTFSDIEWNSGRNFLMDNPLSDLPLYKRKDNREFYTVQETQADMTSVAVRRRIDHGDWLTGLGLLILFLFIWIRLFYGKFYAQLADSMTNYQISVKLYFEKNILTRRVSLALDIVYFIVFAVFVYELVNYAGIQGMQIRDYVLYLIILGILFGYSIARITLIRLTGFVFQNVSVFAEYIHHTYIYNKGLGLVLFPVVILLIYVPSGLILYVLATGVAIYLTAFVFKVIRAYKIIIRKDVLLFYMILYLCTLEILPLLLGYKVMKSLILSY